MKQLTLNMSEYCFSGVMSYRDLYGSQCNVRDSAEAMILDLIESKPELKEATTVRHETFNND